MSLWQSIFLAVCGLGAGISFVFLLKELKATDEKRGVNSFLIFIFFFAIGCIVPIGTAHSEYTKLNTSIEKTHKFGKLREVNVGDGVVISKPVGSGEIYWALVDLNCTTNENSTMDNPYPVQVPKDIQPGEVISARGFEVFGVGDMTCRFMLVGKRAGKPGQFVKIDREIFEKINYRWSF